MIIIVYRRKSSHIIEVNGSLSIAIFSNQRGIYMMPIVNTLRNPGFVLPCFTIKYNQRRDFLYSFLQFLGSNESELVGVLGYKQVGTILKLISTCQSFHSRLLAFESPFCGEPPFFTTRINSHRQANGFLHIRLSTDYYWIHNKSCILISYYP